MFHYSHLVARKAACLILLLSLCMAAACGDDSGDPSTADASGAGDGDGDETSPCESDVGRAAELRAQLRCGELLDQEPEIAECERIRAVSAECALLWDELSACFLWADDSVYICGDGLVGIEGDPCAGIGRALNAAGCI